MNDLIERYIYDVIRRLPGNERSEIKRELEASITDMLPDNSSKQDVIDVLNKLGAPRILAEQYRQKPQYLISPSMFDDYISVLKAVTAIVAAVCGCIGAVLALSSGSIVHIITWGIAMAFEGALQTVLWVTIGFVISEKCVYKKEWKPEDLPPLPTGIKISRSSSITGMIMSVFLPVLLIAMIIREEWFFMFVRGSDIINPLSQTALERFIPYLVILGVLGFVVNGFRLYWAKWNIPLCIINTIYNVVWAGVVMYALSWPDLINYEFLEYMDTIAGGVDILKYVGTGAFTIMLSVVLIVITSVEIVTGIRNTWKSVREVSN